MRRPLARILHEAFYSERRKHGIFGSILEIRTRMYFSTIRPQISRINFALRARTFQPFTALATKFRAICGLAVSLVLMFGLCPFWTCGALGKGLKENIYQVGQLKPVDSQLKVKVGDEAPDFTLPALKGGEITLSEYRGKKNVILSFVPAAWTPVCSDQWPGYNIARNMIEKYDAVLLGITVDNLPTLYAWTKEMGELWFPVLSDFWPHGSIAERYGILRSEGVSERALFVIDRQGIIRYIDVHDINKRPDLDELIRALENLSQP